jgi:glycosyltransferase involved in cell wall biosynthesis
VSSDASYLDKIGITEGIEVKNIEMTRQITPLKDLKAVYKMYKYFKKEKPFIVHTHTPKAGTVGMLAAKLAGIPNRLHTVAGLPLLEATGFKRLLLNFVEKITYSCASRIYPNSFGLKDIIIKEKFCKPQKLKVLANGSSNGINTSYFNPLHFSETENIILKKKLNIKLDDFVFIFVGRMVADKGINELVEAFRNLGKKTDKIKLVLVGPFEIELDSLNENTLNEIEGNLDIINVGFQDDVRPYLAISDVLVFPSYREGFPNVVMQAGAMGLPSIVTNINGCNEIIKEGENGTIIPVKNSVAIYEAMKKIITDTVFRSFLKQNSRKRIVENYEQSVVWNALLQEYMSLENYV